MTLILLLFAVLLCGNTLCLAQNNSLIVEYSRKAKIPDAVKQIEDPNTRQLAIRQLESENGTFYLYHNQDETLFTQTTITPETTNITIEGNGAAYINTPNNYRITTEKLIDKVFLIEDTLGKFNWEIMPDETKTILNKTCLKAVIHYGDNPETDVNAWFCIEMPIPIGPSGYWGLPGLILELETPLAIYEATMVEPTSNDIKITLPEAGKTIKSDDYKKLKDKKIKELGGTPGGSGIKVITIGG